MLMVGSSVRTGGADCVGEGVSVLSEDDGVRVGR
jgi:hypothetical protein